MIEHASHLFALAISATVVTACVILHYETLRFLSRAVGIHVHKRIGVLVVMLSLLMAHVLEIMIFAMGYMLMQHGVGLGYITGMDEGNFFDFFYGVADLPDAPFRNMAG